MPKFLVTIEGGDFEVEADDEDEAIENARFTAVITADPVDDDEDDDEDEADEGEAEG